MTVDYSNLDAANAEISRLLAHLEQVRKVRETDAGHVQAAWAERDAALLKAERGRQIVLSLHKNAAPDSPAWNEAITFAYYEKFCACGLPITEAVHICRPAVKWPDTAETGSQRKWEAVNLIYDERAGMVAVYAAKERLDCLELPPESFVFIRYFPRDVSGEFIRDNWACSMAKLIAAAPTILDRLKFFRESGAMDVCGKLGEKWKTDLDALIASASPIS